MTFKEYLNEISFGKDKKERNYTIHDVEPGDTITIKEIKSDTQHSFEVYEIHPETDDAYAGASDEHGFNFVVQEGDKLMHQRKEVKIINIIKSKGK